MVKKAYNDFNVRLVLPEGLGAQEMRERIREALHDIGSKVTVRGTNEPPPGALRILVRGCAGCGARYTDDAGLERCRLMEEPLYDFGVSGTAPKPPLACKLRHRPAYLSLVT